jgi:hypothetical protein
MDRLVAMARRPQPRLIVVDRTVGGRYENSRTPEQEVPEQPLPYVWETDHAGRTTVTLLASLAKSPPCRHAFTLKFSVDGGLPRGPHRVEGELA